VEFYWVSSPDTQHSRNVATRPHVSIVIFDSHAAIGTGQAVYMSAVAEELTGVDLDRGVDIFSRVSQGHGAREWTLEDIRPPALHRLDRATASEHSILDPAGDPVHGRARDHRTPVTVYSSCSFASQSSSRVRSRRPGVDEHGALSGFTVRYSPILHSLSERRTVARETFLRKERGHAVDT
jgi:hypothetical protein